MPSAEDNSLPPSEPIELWARTLADEGDLASLPADASYLPRWADAPATAPEPPLDHGFEARRLIGRGGMGEVFRAHQPALEREVALKKLRPERGNSRAARERFLAEAIVTGQLEHPNIVPVYSLGGDRHDPFLAMKLVEGQSWKRLLADQPHDLVRHLGILRQVCHAVAFAHSRAIIHNDIKPANVMLGRFGEVLLLDWGMAVRVDGNPDATSRVRHRHHICSPCGTPRYMAPELALGRGADVGTHTDVFLLGAILYEVLAGRPPNHAPNLVESITIACTGRRPDPPESAPLELRLLCARALQLCAADRPTLAVFQEELDAFLLHRESLQITRDARNRLERCQRKAAATERLPESERDPLYEGFAEAVAGFRQALSLWSGNEPARGGEVVARLAYARTALSHGDLGLAEAQLRRLEAASDGAAAVQAGIDETRARQARQRRQQRRLQLALICAGVLLFGGLTVGLMVLRTKNQDIEDEKERVVAKSAELLAEKQQVELRNEHIAEQNRSILRSQDELRQAQQRAEQQRQFAERRGQIAQDALDKLTFDVHGLLLDELGSQHSRRIAREILDTARESWEALRDVDVEEAVVSQGTARALRKLGSLKLELDGDAAGALVDLCRATDIYAQLAAQAPSSNVLSEFSLTLMSQGMARQYLGQLDSAWICTRQALKISRALARDDGSEAAFRNLAAALDRSSELYDVSGDLAAALASLEELLDIERQIFALHPRAAEARRSLMLALFRALELRLEQGQVERAHQAGVEALELARGLIAESRTSPTSQRDLSMALIMLFQVRLKHGALAEAHSLLREARQIWDQALRMDPGSGRARRDVATGLERLGALRLAEGDVEAALEAHEAGLKLRRELARQFPTSAVAGRDLFVGVWSLAELNNDQGLLARARELYSECLDLCQQVLAQSPGSAQAEQDLTTTLCALAENLEALDDREGARELLAEALSRLELLVERNPDSATLRRDLHIAYSQQGILALDDGSLEQAEEALERSLALTNELRQRDSESVVALEEHSLALTRLAQLRLAQGATQEALRLLAQSLQLDRELVARSPGGVEPRQSLATGLDKLAEVWRALAEPERALAAYNEALELRRRLYEQNPDNFEFRDHLSASLQNMGMVMLEAGDSVAARRFFEENLEFDRAACARQPENTRARSNLVRSLFYLAHSYKLEQQYSEAEALALEAQAEQGRLARLSPGLEAQSQMIDGALQELRDERLVYELLRGEGQPATAREQQLFAVGLYTEGRFQEAADAFAAAWSEGAPDDLELLLTAADAAARVGDGAPTEAQRAQALGFLAGYLRLVRAQIAVLRGSTVPEEQALLEEHTETWRYLRDEYPVFDALRGEDFEALFVDGP